MTSLYVDGNSVFHRLSPRTKLVLLLVVSILLFLTRQPLLLAFALTTSAALYSSLGLGFREGLRRVRPLMVSIAILFAFNLLVNSAEIATIAALRLLALMFVAASVTASTPVSAFIAEITRLARPLERLGLLKAADLGLAVGLTLRFLPEIVARYQAIRDAHAARGLTVKFHTVMIPLVILTLRDADQIATAIDARGVRGG